MPHGPTSKWAQSIRYGSKSRPRCLAEFITLLVGGVAAWPLAARAAASDPGGRFLNATLPNRTRIGCQAMDRPAPSLPGPPQRPRQPVATGMATKWIESPDLIRISTVYLPADFVSSTALRTCADVYGLCAAPNLALGRSRLANRTLQTLIGCRSITR
jgi:hypothetical protein